MTRPALAGLVAIVIAANLAAACLYSGDGPIDPATRASRLGNPVLNALAEGLTVPVPTQGIADVRDIVAFVALAAALFLVALSPHRANAAQSEACRCGPAMTWLVVCAIIVIIMSWLSARVNASLDLSWGWMARFAVGASWAMLIAAMVPRDRLGAVVSGLLVAGLILLLLAIAYRADRGYLHFTWPIGPITITAAMAALWASLAGAGGAIRLFDRPARPVQTVIALVLSIVAGYALQQTGRRAPVLGLVAGLSAVGALYAWRCCRRRVVRAVLLAALLAGAGLAGGYVQRQRTSADRVRSGPVLLRLAYWRLAADMIRAHPLFGLGPDTFVVHMTNAVAPLRSESPQFFHGNLEPYAHNEWLQAAVELGVPAAIVYLALPLGLVWIAARRWNDRARRPFALPLAAGLVTVCVTDAASITMRGPIMPVWYWTLLGLLAAACPADESGPSKARRFIDRLTPAFRRMLLVIAALVCLVVAGLEMTAAAAQARGRLGADGRPAARLFADGTLMARYDAARLVSQAATANTHPAATRIALALWRELYQRFPGYEDIPASYAQELLRGGQEDQARTVLRRAIRDDFTPFSVSANTAYATLCDDDPVEQFLCVRRAIRTGALDDTLKEILVKTLMRSPRAADLLDEGRSFARQVCAEAHPADEAVRGPYVETLRLSAFAREAGRDMAEALADQRLAAEFYERLEASGSRYRRASEAETDAFFTLARMTYSADPSSCASALDAILKAERYAVLGIRHEYAAHPRPAEGFVVGEVMPTEFPARLRPLWRLSALLHLAAGDDRNLDFRIWWSLAPEQWQPQDLHRAWARLARQVHQDFAGAAPDKRPRHYELLLDTARRQERLAAEGNTR